LAIDIKRETFDLFVSNAILSSFSDKLYTSKEKWKELLSRSDVRCQWDLGRDIYRNPIDKRSLQIGIQGEMIKKYNDSIVTISDLTNDVVMINNVIDFGEFNESMLPKELEYTINIC